MYQIVTASPRFLIPRDRGSDLRFPITRLTPWWQTPDKGTIVRGRRYAITQPVAPVGETL